MNVIDAWKQAKEGQQIERPGLPRITKVSLSDSSFSGVIGQAISYDKNWLADDWDVVKEKKKEVYSMKVLREVSYISLIGHIPNNATVTFEWEE